MKKLIIAMVMAAGLSAFAGEQTDLLLPFSTKGPNKYADGQLVADNEICALVWVKNGAAFAGFNYDGTLKDATNNQLVNFVQAMENGHCKNIEFVIKAEDVTDGGKYVGGDFHGFILDTRKPGTSVPSSDGTSLSFVAGWGEIASAGEEPEAEEMGIAWSVIRFGLAETYPVSKKTFDFDPTTMLESGFAVVSPAEGEWQIFKLPEAWVEPFKSPELSLSVGTYWHLGKDKSNIPDPFELESAYKFSAFDIQYEEKALAYLRGDTKDLGPDDYKLLDDWNKQVTPFKEWNADFEVSFDRPVAANSVLLAGFYNYTSAWAGKYTFDWVKDGNDPWVGSSPEKDLAAGEVTRLLYSYIGKSGNVTMTYNEICTKVIQFFCGVKNLSEKNYGTTMTVKLCIYENTGRCNESGRRVVIGTYDYTFCGPLDITFREGDKWPTDAVLPEPNPLRTNHNGRLSFVLPAPTYTAEHKDLAFVGWSNDVDKTIMTYIPTNTWKAYELYGTWKSAQTVEIKPAADKETKAEIKVADEWIQENLKDVTPDKVAEKLQEPVEGGTLPAWQTYVLGLDPTGNVSAVQVQKESENKTLVISTVEAPAPDSGFKVKYSLDKIESDETTVRKEGPPQDDKDITIDLDEKTAGEVATGYYKMNVIILPEDTTGAPIESEKVKVPSETTVGVLQVKTEEPLVPIAVPWTSLANVDDDIPADEIVQPQGLNDGDMLYVYDQNGGVYSTMTLRGGKWTVDAQTVPVGEVGSDEAPVSFGTPLKVKRGNAMWLKRSDTSKPFYLFGQYNKTGEATQINPPAQGQSGPEFNLIAPTGIEPQTDLNEIETLNDDNKIDEGDQLMLVKGGVPTYLRHRDGKWGYYKSTLEWKNGRPVAKKVWVTDGAKVDAGIGLWYISAGGNPTIQWEGAAE